MAIAKACRQHTKGDGVSWWKYDARGIPLCRVCDKCRKAKLAEYQPNVLTDPNYWTDEAIEEN